MVSAAVPCLALRYPGWPVEFGYKAQVVDNEDGPVLDYDVKVGNPADAKQLAPAIRRISGRLGWVPEQTTAYRGYGEAGVDQELEQLGAQTVVIPRKGKLGKALQEVEHSSGFRALVQMAHWLRGPHQPPQRRYGWNRSLVDGPDRTAAWYGYGVLAHKPGQGRPDDPGKGVNPLPRGQARPTDPKPARHA